MGARWRVHVHTLFAIMQLTGRGRLGQQIKRYIVTSLHAAHGLRIGRAVSMSRLVCRVQHGRKQVARVLATCEKRIA